VGGFAVSNRVVVRNNFGRFIADIEGAATATVKEAAEKGESIAQGLAPVGGKVDPRTAPIHASFFTQVISRTSAIWGNTARHALHQEFGTGPHTITGSPYLHFFWQEAGRWWVPGLFGPQDVVNHPGHGEQPYLRPSYRAVSKMLLDIAKKHYPG
jgi:hypothetical protein